MNVRYRVELSQTERAEFTALLSGGRRAARKLKRAQILLAADAGASDDDIATSVGVGGSTVYRTKQRFVLGNLEAALCEEPRPGASRKLSGQRGSPAGRDRLFQATARAAPVGPWSCWRVRSSGSPNTTVSPVRPCADGWPKTTSSPGAGTCGEFRRSMASTSPAWRMCSTSMQKSPIRSTRSSVSTRVRPSSSAKSASRSRRRRARSSVTTVSTSATGGAAPAGVPLCPQARQLAEHGRDRDWRAAQPMSGPAYRNPGTTCVRNRRLGTAAQCFRSPHQMDVHNRKGPRQNGPRLPRTDQRQIALGQRVITIVQRY